MQSRPVKVNLLAKVKLIFNLTPEMPCEGVKSICTDSPSDNIIHIVTDVFRLMKIIYCQYNII